MVGRQERRVELGNEKKKTHRSHSFILPMAARLRLAILLLHACAMCRCFSVLHPPAQSSLNTVRSCAQMRASSNKNKLTRRELADGSSLAKQFYDPKGFRSGLPVGWSPALVLFLGAAVSNYGGSVRTKLFDELRELGAGAKNQGAVRHVPMVTIARGRSSSQVSVEVAAPPTASGDPVEYIWASDAATGEILAGRRFSPSEPATLMLNVDRGRRIVPSVACRNDGVWEGETILAVAPQ